MERLDSNNESSIDTLPRLCQARASERCNRTIEPTRAKTALYCSLCAPVVQRRKSAEYKRNLRNKLGWRRYRAEYLSCTEEEDRALHRERSRRWRERKRWEMKPLAA